MKTIGRHVIAEFYECSNELLNNQEIIRTQMIAAAQAVGATVVADAFHTFSPQGVSGTVVIAESHLSIHTWPENGYVAVDIYTCGGLDPRPGIDYLGRALRAKQCRVQEIVRGLPADISEGRDFLPEDVQVIASVVEPSEIPQAS